MMHKVTGEVHLQLYDTGAEVEKEMVDGKWARIWALTSWLLQACRQIT